MIASFILMLQNAKDILWKGIIEELFADFLRFFYADADELFDMERGFDFLDKELGQLYPDVDLKHPKFVDKLVRVYRKNGKEEWLLIHIEVQGYKDPAFARRMFTYFYRILDRFDKAVASIAIFTDKDDHYQPDRYVYDSLETSNVFRFKTYKVRGQDIATLENSDNPFAVVVSTVLIALQAPEKDPAQLFDLSMDLVRRMFRKGFPKKKIRSLLDFIKSYVCLGDKEMLLKFDEEIDNFHQKKATMTVREIAQQLYDEMTRLEITSNLLNKTNHPVEEIAVLVGMPVEYVLEVKDHLAATAAKN
jgi:hypothetical protein